MGFRDGLVSLCAVLALLTPAQAAERALDLLLTHPDGASIRITAIDAGARSIVLTAAIANPGDRAIRLDAAQSFLLKDAAGGVWRLNPPEGNPELSIPAHASVRARLVFIGPLDPGVSRLTLSTNDGIGTPDNPYDATPVFQAALPVAGAGGMAGGGGQAQADHPNGAQLHAGPVAVYPGAVALSLVLTNGNARTIELDPANGLVLRVEGGASLPLEAPATNPTLAVPSGQALAARLVFSGTVPAGTRDVTLSVNDGSGTRDNPYDTTPLFALTLPVGGRQDGAPPASHPVLSPIARSVLSAPTSTATMAAAAPAPPPPSSAEAPAAEPSSGLNPAPPALPPTSQRAPEPALQPPPRATPQPAPVAAPPAAPPPQAAPPPSPMPVATMSVAELKRVLHATETANGLTVALPADLLFGGRQDTLSRTADTALAELQRLIAALRPREILVAGNTDGTGRDDANMKLSQQRAQAVAAWIGAHEVRGRAHIVAKGYGRTRPVAPNTNPDGSDNPAGRALNRRIDVSLQG